MPAERALRQPEVDVRDARRDQGQLTLEIDDPLVDFGSLETMYRYEGYLRRQGESVERLKRQESRAIPAGLRVRGDSWALAGVGRAAVLGAS